VDILVLKLTVTPILIGVSALVGRRWGPGLGGWLVGIPFTSGPIALVLSISQGWHFAGDTAVGTLAGTASEAVFCLAYALAASSFTWRLSLTAGVAGFGGATLALFRLPLSVAPALAIAAAGVALALALSPRPASGSAQPQTGAPGGIRDIGARMVVATAVVLALTGAATLLGSTLTGLLAPFPIFGAVMMVFSQRRQGGSAGIAAARGLLWGLFGAALFFLVLATLLPRFGLIAFLPAVLADLAAQGATLPLARQGWPVNGASPNAAA
jgi:small-conductance mechanosensitive channel